MHSHSFEAVESLWIFLLIIEGQSATIIQGPSNIVTEIREHVKLNCTADATIAYWTLSKNGEANGELEIVGPGCSVNAPYGDHYTVESLAGGFICNLNIFNIAMDQAGVYKCVQGSFSGSSILTVTDSSATITYNNTPDVIEREIVVITCSLNYSGSVEPAPTLRPYFYWTDYTGNNVSSFNDAKPTNSLVVFHLSVTAGRQDIMPYTCHVYLKLIPTTSPGYASNTPSVSSSASSPTVTVLYKPSKPSSRSRPEVISINGVPCGISVLTCSSTANPAPKYRWYYSADNVVLSTTNTLDLAEVNRNYICEAYNTIRNVLNSESTTYIVSKDNCSTSTVNCCVFPRDETTSVKVEGCDSGTLCDCSQGSSGIILTCNSTSFPNASYMWNGQLTDSPVYDEVTMNGTYRCTAYFDKALSNYTGNVIFPTGTDEKTVDRCYNAATTTISSTPIATATTTPASTSSTPSTDSDVAIAAVAIAMGVLFGISLLVIIILLVILIRGKRVPDLFIRTENVLEPETLDTSDFSTPSTYEELRRPDEMRSQPTTYEQLTLKPPLHVNQIS